MSRSMLRRHCSKYSSCTPPKHEHLRKDRDNINLLTLDTTSPFPQLSRTLSTFDTVVSSQASGQVNHVEIRKRNTRPS